MASGKALVDLLSEEICRILEERAKAQATADLEFALACFEMDQQGTTKKIKDVHFDPLPTISTYEIGPDC
ncbi:unnamed protein product [Miscanthus lutarioriparius]|uniref:Uncharacterized protein n=1 Tax=Miscanthus lutarioriparius TaxID=422564 RepID=A0A811NPX9_9POAL|nr:unnamed protein product [Miscanthus lutarioriparius]